MEEEFLLAERANIRFASSRVFDCRAHFFSLPPSLSLSVFLSLHQGLEQVETH